MNGLIRINYDTEQPTVSARDLHEVLGVEKDLASGLKRTAQVLSKEWITPRTFGYTPKISRNLQIIK
ncbi:hypothetical protein [Hungatella hathewayi]|uniref:hypothetical protein n=1 Tax=Hungatella hathewayi TaxID=154046 RepID=UPI0026DD6349|nr:hypothetical protein [Hungatella hathewayi]